MMIMNTTSKRIALLLLIAVALGVGIFTLYQKNYNSQSANTGKPKQRVVINEAVKTLLYLPLYHAVEKGFFEKNGLQVEIVTGGTATNSFAAMMSGEAQFSQADPMYVPISNEKKADTRVIAQVVSRIAVWGLTMDTATKEMSNVTLKGKTISTQTSPMTAYTYTIKTITDLGLTPDKDVKVIQTKPGGEITPMLSGQAEYSMTLEPNVSIATNRGAKVILSYPKILGDQIFTGLIAKQSFINQNTETVIAVLKSYQESINDLYANKEAAIATAIKYFPQLDRKIVTDAVNRILDEEVIPKSILMTEESWDKAMKVRVQAGDLSKESSREENVRVDLIKIALQETK